MFRPDLISALVCASAIALTACGAPVMMPSGEGALTKAATPASETEPLPASARSAGLTEASNDPKIVAAVKKVLTCPWTDEDGFDQECAAYKEWSEKSDLLEVEDGADAKKPAQTMLNLVEDKDEKVRTLALDKFPSRGDDLFADKTAALRILAQASHETSKSLKRSFGELVGSIDLDKTGLASDVKKLLDASRSKELRGSVLRTVLAANPHSRPALDLVLASAKSDDAEVRYDSLLGLGQGDFAAESCTEYQRSLEDKSSDVVGIAAQQFGYMRCPADVDMFIGFAKKRAAAGEVKEFLVANALANLCDSDKVSKAQKKEAASVARTLAATKNDVMVRGDAIQAVVTCDPEGGRSFAQGFAKDPSSYVKDTVGRALKQKKKK